jgi:hypothetical protein
MLRQQIALKYDKYTHKLDPLAKSTGNIFMKLEIWVDGSLEIMHIFLFSSYVEILFAMTTNSFRIYRIYT